MDLLSTIEHSAISTWVREGGSFWAYPGILFIHTVGVSIVIGISAMIGLRVLGFAPALPIVPLEGYFPIIWIAFWISAVSGAILLAADATTTITNPVFDLKMILIALGVVTMARLRRVVFRTSHADGTRPAFGKLLAAASLVMWFGAAAAGRLMPYLGAVTGLPGVTNTIGR